MWSSGVLIIASLLAQTPPFSIGVEIPNQVPTAHAVQEALHDMGIDYVSYYVKPHGGSTDALAVETNRPMLQMVDRLGVSFTLGCYPVSPPARCVQEARAFARENDDVSGFDGVVFNEIMHCRLLNPHSPELLGGGQAFDSFETAYETVLRDLRSLRTQTGVPCIATHFWPVLLHLSARAGFTVCPKICKESFSPVSMAIALGAALQYNTGLWADVDLWMFDMMPGHPPEEFESNLMLAYWLGVDRVYVEGVSHTLLEVGRQGGPISLVNTLRDDVYQLTAHGQVLRRFATEYVPSHPRPWSFRDCIPQVAIVRFPDSDHGQSYLPIGFFKPYLYGSPELPPNADTEAWFALWNLLTKGKTGRDGLTYFKPYFEPYGIGPNRIEGRMESLYSRPQLAEIHSFWVPLTGVVVYDHLVGYELLADVPCIFVTGLTLSRPTFDAVMRRVEEGALVVMWAPLAARMGIDDFDGGLEVRDMGAGKLILLDDFGHGDLRKYIWPYEGRPDEIRYRFGKHEMTLHRIDDNRVRVEVSPPIVR